MALQQQLPKACDFLVVGGGIVGMTIARELRQRHPQTRIVVLEKEPMCGLHASGRNSGVIHAGFYYPADSLKARFTREGNVLMTKFCEEKKLRLNRCGKLVVCKTEQDLVGLDILLSRAQANGVPVHEVTEKEAKEIEPRCQTHERALFSPTTSAADPKEVIHAVVQEAVSTGTTVLTGTRYLQRSPASQGSVHTVETSQGRIESGYLINAAGLYADKISRNMGVGANYAILPFKGLYLYANANFPRLRTHIYPVPNLANPFLGVHFTVTVNGETKIGPTAIPALWREQYNGFDAFDFQEFFEIIVRQFGLVINGGFDFSRLAIQELIKYHRPTLIADARPMLKGLETADFDIRGKPGIRAQLLNLKERKLVMDFLVEEGENSIHILNAVSPAWTCSMPFAKFVCDKIDASPFVSS